MNSEDILYCFHHIHHYDFKNHKVHHCGGAHRELDSTVDYDIMHCKCCKHAISKQQAVGHTADKNLNNVELLFEFSERCPEGGWHIESGKIVK